MLSEKLIYEIITDYPTTEFLSLAKYISCLRPSQNYIFISDYSEIKERLIEILKFEKKIIEVKYIIDAIKINFYKEFLEDFDNIIILALENNSVPIINHLLITVTDYDMKNVFLNAILYNRIDFIKKLLEKESDYNFLLSYYSKIIYKICIDRNYKELLCYLQAKNPSNEKMVIEEI